MITICIDPGHGGNANGGGSNRYWLEKDKNLEMSLKLKERLTDHGFKAVLTRETDKDLTLYERAQIAKQHGADLLLSSHINNVADPGPEGAVIIHQLTYDGKFAHKLLDRLVAAGATRRRVTIKKSVSYPGEDWYGILRESARVGIEALIIEYGFASNESDTQKILKHWSDYVEAVTMAVCSKYGVEYKKGNKLSIMGETKATRDQMIAYLLKINKDPLINCSVDELVDYYISIGKEYNVRGDLAFSQALKETGYFRYGGIVLPEQNNYAGLGALNDNKKGDAADFTTPAEGVLAQIQHLHGYASGEPFNDIIVDPRYVILKEYGLLGSAPYITDLNGKWAWPGDGYGESITRIYNNILSMEVTKDYKQLYYYLYEDHQELLKKYNSIVKKISDIKKVIGE